MRREMLLCCLAVTVIGWKWPPIQAGPQRRVARVPGNAAAPAGATDVWQVIYLGKSRIGYSHAYTRPVVVGGKPHVRCDFETHLTIKRFGQSLQIETRQETEEDPDGGLSSYVFEMKNPPAAPTRCAGRVEGNRLAGEMTVGGTARPFSLAWETGIKSSDYLDRLPREHAFKTGETLACKVFLPEQMQVSDVRLTAGRREAVTLLDGRRRSLLKLTVLESILPQTPTHSYLDEQGRTLVSTTDMLGQTLTAYTVGAEEAMREVAGGQVDIAINTLVSSTAIPQAHRTRMAIYRMKLRGGEDPTPYFPNSPQQKVIRKGIDECEITVRAVPVTATNRSTRVDSQYLASSRYLQTTDRDVLMHVDRAARNLIDPAQIALAMEKYVNRELHRKDFSTALGSAAEVARSLQGDCTEHAVLLAAMLRARKIPSRIAVGLVYIESLSAFGGHMWTEALLGDRWVPLDATLGQGGTGAAHIKLADSSFADNVASPMTTFLPLLHVLGRLELTVVETSLR